MTESNLDENGAQWAWDSTSLQWAQDCLWKYKTGILEGWRPKRDSVHLLFGGWYASALERFHRLLAEGAERDEALRTVVHEALIATWLERHDGTFGPWESDRNDKTRANLIRTIVWYVDYFNPDPLEVVVLSDGRAAVEYSFTVELTKEIVWSGHIDRLVRYNGDVYVQDQKTTASTVSARYFEGFNPDIQMTGYTFAAQIIWPSPVKGVIIDAAQIAVGFSRFERGFTFRTPGQLEEWRVDSLHYIESAREAARRGFFPRNRTACDKFGGCLYRSVCSRSPEVRQQFLDADFDQRPPWNPMKKRGALKSMEAT